MLPRTQAYSPPPIDEDMAAQSAMESASKQDRDATVRVLVVTIQSGTYATAFSEGNET